MRRETNKLTKDETNEEKNKQIARSTSNFIPIPIIAKKYIQVSGTLYKNDMIRKTAVIRAIKIHITKLNPKNLPKIILLLLTFFALRRKIVLLEISCCKTLDQKNKTKISPAISIRPILKSLITFVCSERARDPASTVPTIKRAPSHTMI